jgi:hypothetical protein
MITLKDCADLATVVGAVSLVVSAWLLFQELRTNNKLVKAANTQSLVGLSSPFNLSLIQDRNLAELSVRGASQYETMDHVDQYRYKCLIHWWLIYYENVYYQRQQGMLDKLSYEPWATEMLQFIQEHRLDLHWNEMRSQYQVDFAEHISRVIAAQGRRTEGEPILQGR